MNCGDAGNDVIWTCKDCPSISLKLFNGGKKITVWEYCDMCSVKLLVIGALFICICDGHWAGVVVIKGDERERERENKRQSE